MQALPNANLDGNQSALLGFALGPTCIPRIGDGLLLVLKPLVPTAGGQILSKAEARHKWGHFSLPRLMLTLRRAVIVNGGIVDTSAIVGSTVPDDLFPHMLDLVEAARLLRIHPLSLRRLIKQGKIPAMMFAGKYLLEREAVDTFRTSYDPRPGRKPLRRLL